ncbi:hypothetical protein [Solidesulfovibrio sp. C21]|uniref:hypothetical protein n=1 Tax=Solidesulfovibrio sp. C21 TaxID=3398613 RepID=UPI0039FD1108
MMGDDTCYTTYKGYCLECAEEDGELHGHIAGIRDVVTFHGETPEALMDAFREAVDDYLDVCGEACLAPDDAKGTGGKLF